MSTKSVTPAVNNVTCFWFGNHH